MKLHKGFTLIEALVASMILFAVVTSMTMLYQTTLKAEYKARQAVESASVIPFILDHIQYQIRYEHHQQGEGTMQGVSYEWNASVIKKGKGYVPDGLEDHYGDQTERYTLWQVNLNIADRAPIHYKEFSW